MVLVVQTKLQFKVVVITLLLLELQATQDWFFNEMKFDLTKILNENTHVLNLLFIENYLFFYNYFFNKFNFF